MEHKTMPIASLTENPKNPNMHPQEQIEDIAKSITEYGQYYPIIVDERDSFSQATERREPSSPSEGRRQNAS